MMTLRPALLRCAVGSLRTAPQIFPPNMGAAGVLGSKRFLFGFGQDPIQGKSMETSLDAEMEQEIKDKISSIQVQLGDRRAEMLVGFKLVAPSLGPLALDHLANSIDKHEDFGNPQSLGYKVSDGTLFLHHSAPGDPWVVRLTTFSALPLCEQNALEAAVHSQIEKQKEMFPHRSIVKAASDKHFLTCLDEMKDVMNGIDAVRSQRAKKVEAEDAAEKVFRHFYDFFEDLETQGVDVKDALKDSWKPLNVLKAAAWHARLDQLARSKETDMILGPDGQFLLMYEAYQFYKNQQQLATLKKKGA